MEFLSKFQIPRRGIVIREVVSDGRAVGLRLGDDVSVVGFVCLFVFGSMSLLCVQKFTCSPGSE